MALQFTATNGPSARWLQAWMARATSSLPVPDSPRTSTGAMLRATLAMRSLTLRIGCESPTSRCSAACAAGRAARRRRPAAAPPRRRAARAAAPLSWIAEATTLRNCFRSTGLVR